MDRIPIEEFPPSWLKDYILADNKGEGYSVSRIVNCFQPIIAPLVQEFNLKRKTTYISEESLYILRTVVALITQEAQWGWANWMNNAIIINIEYLKRHPLTICPLAEILNLLLESHFPCSQLAYVHRTVAICMANDRRQ